MARTRKYPIPWFVLAMIMAFLTMSTVQVIWLRSSIEMKKQIFTDNVFHSLSQVGEIATRPTTGILQLELEALSQAQSNATLVQPGRASIGDGLDEAEARMLRRFDAFHLDSLIGISLQKHGIEIPWVMGVFDRYGQPVRLAEADEMYRTNLEVTPFQTATETLSIRLHFPSLPRYLLYNLLGQFALTGLMLSIIAWGFFSAVIGAARNKRIDRIRRDLMNNLTHELKTPISTIGLASEALGDPDMLKDADGTKHYIALIKEENKRLGVLVENVLQASLADSGKMQLYMQSINAHDLIKEVLRNLAIQIRKRGGRVELLLDANNPIIEADRIHFTNVIFNLIDNALKYSLGDPHLTITTVQATDGLELRFQDNGIGIAKEHLGKVFDSLYRVPTGNVHDVKGFGLGLSYVQTVVERHNGRIRVESELEKGSTFILLLPQ
jgi:two-component system, OmpR family, phosphate regulon sensor histidine kinase PhoR